MREVWREGKIGAQNWTILLVDREDLAGTEEVFGLCVYEQNEIWILRSEAGNETRFWDTLVHELQHAAFKVFAVKPSKDEETNIERTTPAILAAFDGFRLLAKLEDLV